MEYETKENDYRTHTSGPGRIPEVRSGGEVGRCGFMRLPNDTPRKARK